MEDHAQIARTITNAAFDWFKNRVGDAVGTAPRDLGLREELLVPTIQWFEVLHQVGVVYNVRSYHVLGELESFFKATVAAQSSMHTIPHSDIGTPEQKDEGHAAVERDRYEFTRAYVGADTIPRQLARYILRCAGESAGKPQEYKYPYISILQSSGFGKSRLLRELANRTKDDPHGEMKVLYTCMQSSGYPAATFFLRNYFFPWAGLEYPDSVLDSSRMAPTRFSRLYDFAVGLGREIIYGEPAFESSRDTNELAIEDALAARLVRLYEYAAMHWDAIGPEWFQLFDEQAADAAICKRLENFKMEERRRMAGFARHKDRFVVLAIDEARILLHSSPHRPTSWFERLRRALNKASGQIRKKFGAGGGVFVVLADTNSKVTNFVPPARQNHPNQSNGTVGDKLFPPFILTHSIRGVGQGSEGDRSLMQ